ncbi:MAG: uncharacterized protein PWP69_1069 [Enterococcus sp.]|uniref:DUF871 domain-containing protein n=1 Tax=Enterococcus sp. TaxID=35783 RepID=UPI0025900418|nr:MupG family TIM beta-alpha barrel fold protein [Enterococcus sp.]MDK2844277.1 uncharacterized protein [Enterococcus sp.]
MYRELGISIYPNYSNFEEDLAYLKLAHQYGFSRLFISMLEINSDAEKLIEKFKQTIHYARELNFEVILDVSPRIFSVLGISYDDLTFFEQLGASGIRLDQGFDGNKEALLSFNEQALVIELNMSNDVKYLDNIVSYQPNLPFLYGCHNFYPQEGTGLPYDYFVKCSQRFKQYGLKTAAFITSPSGQLGPWPINDGLVTLEMCRKLPITTQAKILFYSGLVDTVIIGDAYASEAELKALAELDRYRLTFDCVLDHHISPIERRILDYSQHFRRGDINERVARSTQTRVLYKSEANPVRAYHHEFMLGDIVVGNEDFMQYKNELQIVLTPHRDARKNHVAHIVEEEQILLQFLHPWTKFKLNIVE